MSITRSLDRQNRYEWPLVLRMTTLFKWLVNTANSSSTFVDIKTKNAMGSESERVVQIQRTVIFIYGAYGSINMGSVCFLDPDEWVIAAPKSSSWLPSPSTFGFNGGAYLIGVGQTLRGRTSETKRDPFYKSSRRR